MNGVIPLTILDQIDSPEALQELNGEELERLAEEIRAFLIENIARTGGHLAANLGAVELTIALHRVYDTARDRVVFDVGHQSYVHKLLTGRRDRFDTLRALGGLSGFPKPGESVHDAFIAGHASNSVSVALGMARARTLRQEDYDVAAVIGDGALSGGLAYEGLSDAGESGERIVVILNDNGMSISTPVGGIARLLSRLRVGRGYLRFKRSYRGAVRTRFPGLYAFTHRVKEAVKRLFLPDNIFDEMGFYYLGPVDGHDLGQLEDALRTARELACPVLLHVRTVKGKGYAPAEEDPAAYHGVCPFDPEQGVTAGRTTYSDVFGETLCALAARDRDIVAITAAMRCGTGLDGFSEQFPDRTFDVGIAEGHAVSMAAGLAKQGAKPVFAVYSSFLQRSYDMLIHDVSLLGLHVVLGVDRAGLVGGDGETHHGVFDVGFLRTVPGMTVLCPASFAELRSMLELAVEEIKTPVAIRYPRGGQGRYTDDASGSMVAVLGEGADAALVVYGDLVNEALAAVDTLAEQGIHARIVKLGVIRPLDTEALAGAISPCRAVVVAEEVCAAGCVGLDVRAMRPDACLVNLGGGIVPQGPVSELRHSLGLDGAKLAEKVMELLGEDTNGKDPAGSASV
jgi:1-deoxy-D-xylulose-5-phosphate synthase